MSLPPNAPEEAPIAEDAVPIGPLHPSYHIPDPDGEWPDDVELGPFDPEAPLVPFHPRPIQPGDVIGKTLTGVSRFEGTYGMGGLGFFSLALGDMKLVVAFGCAAEWIHVNGTMIEDPHWAAQRRPRPLCAGMDEEALRALIVGRAIASARFGRRSFTITLDDGTTIGLDEDPRRRPPHHPTGYGRRMLKQFGPFVDIRLNIFVMPNCTLWT